MKLSSFNSEQNCDGVVPYHNNGNMPYLYLGYFSTSSIYLFKVNSGNTTAICKICSKLIRKTPERCQ